MSNNSIITVVSSGGRSGGRRVVIVIGSSRSLSYIFGLWWIAGEGRGGCIISIDCMNGGIIG